MKNLKLSTPISPSYADGGRSFVSRYSLLGTEVESRGRDGEGGDDAGTPLCSLRAHVQDGSGAGLSRATSPLRGHRLPDLLRRRRLSLLVAFPVTVTLVTGNPDAKCVKCGARIGLWLCAQWCDDCIDKLPPRGRFKVVR